MLACSSSDDYWVPAYLQKAVQMQAGWALHSIAAMLVCNVLLHRVSQCYACARLTGCG